MSRLRSLVLVACVVLLAGLLPTAVLAADPPPIGDIVINDGAEWTNQAVVSVALPYPTDGVGLVRMSNDGANWSAPQAWAATIAWDITDAAAGGNPGDGDKIVWAEWDDGSGAWSEVGTALVWLDRTAPVIIESPQSVMCHYTDGWVAKYPCWPGADDFPWGTFDIDRLEFALDGGPWTSTSKVWPGGFDFRTMMWGGGWRSTDRELCVRAVDKAGNVGAPQCASIDLSIPNPIVNGFSTFYDVRFEFPRPAVTGQLFTIRPVYPPNFPHVPNSAICQWILRWGDEGKLRDEPNEDYGQIWVTRQYGKGGCDEWTFTLPYTPGLTYSFDFSLDPNWREPDLLADVYASAGTPNISVTEFKATVGTYERGIPHSTMGLAYLLPEQFIARPGEPVTYRLHASDTPGWKLPSPAWFWAANNECGHNIGDDHPTSSTVFTYTPDCQGPWWTGWTWEDWDSHEYLRAEFDPPADKAAPVVSAPQAIVRPEAQLGSTIPMTISWTATDPLVHTVNTGVVRNQLQVRRNGGRWKNVTLATPTATGITVNLLATGNYRYRVRSYDGVGNRSAWRVGPILHPRLVQESNASLSAGWSKVTGASFSGGSASRTSSALATASVTFNGRAISWVGSIGPDQGLAQVYVDGVLAQTVDLSGSASADRRVLFSRSWGALGKHTLRIVVLGTFARPAVSVDAFVVVT